MTNVKSFYGHENNFPTINSCQFIHKTWDGVWVVTPISSIRVVCYLEKHRLDTLCHFSVALDIVMIY